jgi:hypothetical protein
MKLGHIPLSGGLELDSLLSFSVLPSDAHKTDVARRGEIRHEFALKGGS